VGIDEEKFDSLLDQVRELHRLADELTRSPGIRENVRARVDGWPAEAPSIPMDQRKVADDVVDALTTPRLSASQSRLLRRTFFGR